MTRALWLASALALLPALLVAGFVWDDLEVALDPALSGAGAVGHALTSPFLQPDASGNAGLAMYWRPAVKLLWLLPHALGGAAWAFHALNALLHLSVIGLALRLFARVLPGRDPAVLALGVAFLGLHPATWESTLWVCGVCDVGLSLAALLGLLAALDPSPVLRRLRLVASVALGLAFKETALVLPAVFFLGVLARPDRPGLRVALLDAVPAALCVLAYLVGRALWLPLAAGLEPPSVLRHAGFVLETCGRYAAIVAWPWPLTFLRTLVRHDATLELLPSASMATLGALVLCAGVLALWRWRREPTVLLGAGLVLLPLLPVLNVRWMGLLNLVADRYLYLPLLGVGLLVAHVASPRVARAGVLALILLGVSSLTLRAVDLKNDLTLWTAEAEAHPEWPEVTDFLARAALADGRDGLALAAEAHAASHTPEHGGDVAEAGRVVRLLQHAAAILPDDPTWAAPAAAFVHSLRTRGQASGMVLGVPLRTSLAALRRAVPAPESTLLALEAKLLERAQTRDPAEALALVRTAGPGSRDGAWTLARLGAVPDAPPPELEAALAAPPGPDRLLALGQPLRALEALTALPPSPRREIARIRALLLAFRFAEARAVWDAIEASAPPEAKAVFQTLSELEARQQRRIAGYRER